jgi:exodeoxyribonuclease VII small subunit
MSTDDPSIADGARGKERDETARPNIGYEAARAELTDVVRRLESGGQTLEESLALWQRGEELAEICEQWLSGATARLNAAIAAKETGPPAGGGDESGS